MRRRTLRLRHAKDTRPFDLSSRCSIWLKLEQRGFDDDGRGDLDRAVFDAALRFRLGSVIPSPQVTALYGFGNVEEEDEIVRLFREDVKRVL